MSLRVRLLFNFPTYKVLAVSIVSIILGTASVALSVIGLVNQIWGHYVATGIWSGSVIAIAGFFGIASAQTRGVCVVKTFMMFSLFSCLVSLGAIALSIGGLVYDSKFYKNSIYHPNTKIIHGLLLGTGLLQTVLSLICAIICIKHVCCRPRPKVPLTSAEPVEIVRPEFRRGGNRDSQASSAPLMSSSKHKRQNDSNSAQQATTSDGVQSSSRDHHSSSSPHRHSRERSSADKRRQKSRSERSPSDGCRPHSPNRERRHSSEREGRNRITSHRSRSPDRYADKPNRSTEVNAPNEVGFASGQAIAAGLVDRMTEGIESQQDSNENIEQLIVHNNLEGLPAYEDVIQDNGLDDSVIPLSISETEFIDGDSVSLSSRDNLSVGATAANCIHSTHLKEIEAEHEALRCLSAALQTPVVAANSGISNCLSDPRNKDQAFKSISENSNSEAEGVRKLSTNLVTHSQDNSGDDDDGACAPDLSRSERQALLRKFNSSDPDPQGVRYKEFSRHSDVIKESVDDTKPKRSKSFQHTREREFARGKYYSARQLSCDDENQHNDPILENKQQSDFRLASRSFSRASSIPLKPPPKPPRTSSLRQTNGAGKDRPKSATLPYSQFALLKSLDEGKTSDSETKQNEQANLEHSESLIKTDFEKKDNLHKIQPPRFRYQRPKLTDTTFKEPQKAQNEDVPSQVFRYNKLYQTSKEINPVQPSESVGGKSTIQGKLTDDVENIKPVAGGREHLTLPVSVIEIVQCPTQTLSQSTLPAFNKQIVQSPLQSPTDYSAIPLKDILLKGQETAGQTHRLSDLELASNYSEEINSDESSSSSSSSSSHPPDNGELSESNNDVDNRTQADNDGKPMYSFLL